MTSADSCRTREIEDVGMAKLVYVGRLLRMDGDSSLLPVWRSAGVRFTGKEKLNVWAVMAVT